MVRLGEGDEAAFERRARNTSTIRKLPTRVVVQGIRSKVGMAKLSHPPVTPQRLKGATAALVLHCVMKNPLPLAAKTRIVEPRVNPPSGFCGSGPAACGSPGFLS